MFISTPCSQKPSVYVPPLNSEIEFQRTTGKIKAFYIIILCFLTEDKKMPGSGLNGSKHYENLISS
jgi:hypothetical protein